MRLKREFELEVKSPRQESNLRKNPLKVGCVASTLRRVIKLSSRFLELPDSEWVADNDLAFAIRDAYPVKSGIWANVFCEGPRSDPPRGKPRGFLL